METLRQKRVIKEIINRNFTFADLSPRFKGVDSNTGNIYCPFHDNFETPAAKMYFNEYLNLWQLHCFGECHASFTAYDYVELVLCIKYQKYKSPVDFLYKNMLRDKLKQQISKYSNTILLNNSDAYADKVDYVNTLYMETENIADYIEKLYTV